MHASPVRSPLSALCVLPCILLLTALASVVRADAAASQPAPATQPTSYKLERFSKDEPLWEGWVVRIDLTDPKLQVGIGTGGPDPDGDGPWETILTPTTKIAKANDFDIAINTVFFMNDRKGRPATVKYAEGDPAASTSLIAAGGKIITQRRTGSPILFDKNNTASIGSLMAVPPDSRAAVAGNQQIVFRGKPVEIKPGGERAPRTAIGTANMGKTLVLFVVDGRRESWSVGMTMQELAQTMADLGCDAAVNLDGGGSTTLVAKRQTDAGPEWKTVNTPSDGSQLPIPLSIERPVPYVLGFRWTTQTQP